MCPRSSDQFYIVSTYIKWVTTSWPHRIIGRFKHCLGMELGGEFPVQDIQSGEGGLLQVNINITPGRRKKSKNKIKKEEK